MENSATNFNHTEEAFILSSLQEVVKVWTRGSGKASFNLDVSDGEGTLKLCFQLGKPGDPHCDPHVPPQPCAHLHQHGQQVQKRHKGPARRRKDCARAAAHQTRLQSQAAVAAVPAALKLPFSGNILPLKNPTPAVPAVVTTPSTSSSGVIKTPQKNQGEANPPLLEKVDSVKKQLFRNPPPPVQTKFKPAPAPKPPYQISPRTIIPPEAEKLSYKKKEEDLWSRLFSS